MLVVQQAAAPAAAKADSSSEEESSDEDSDAKPAAAVAAADSSEEESSEEESDEEVSIYCLHSCTIHTADLLHCLCTAADLLTFGMVHFETVLCGPKQHFVVRSCTGLCLNRPLCRTYLAHACRSRKKGFGPMHVIHILASACWQSMSPDHLLCLVFIAGCTRQGSSQSRHKQ